MTKTDTIVGLVGAVLLVGVMIGVFAYEYNDGDGTTDEGRDQEPVVLSEDYSGSVNPSNSPQSHPFTLEEGVHGLAIHFSGSPTSPLPGTGEFTLTLLRDGMQVEQTTTSGSEKEWTFNDILDGDYELQVSVANPNVGGSYSGTIDATY